MASSLTRGALLTLILGLLAGCASATSSVQPTTPERPAPPDGWAEVASDAGDVRLGLPADFVTIFTATGIMAQEPAANGQTPQLEVLASGPADVVPQPRSGQQLRTWLEESWWVPASGDGGVTETRDATQREVFLPSGPALEVAITAQPGTGDESRVVVYAIATEGGVAIIRFVGSPARMEARVDELLLIALLAEFGDLTDPA